MPFTTIVRERMQHHFPATYLNTTTFFSEREEYLNNYYIEQFRSFVIVLASHALAAVAVIKRKDPKVVLSALITSVGLAVFWYFRANDPVNLFKAARLAIRENDQGLAIELIKKGASLWNTITLDRREVVQGLPNLLYKEKWLCFDSGLADFAVRGGQDKVVEHLIKIGYDFSKSQGSNRAYPLELAPSLDMAQLLMDHGASLDAGVNPLERLLYTLVVRFYLITPKLEKEAQEIYASDLKDRCALVLFYIQKRLHLKRDFMNVWLGTSALTLKVRVNDLDLVDDSVKQEIKDQVGQIEQSIFNK